MAQTLSDAPSSAIEQELSTFQRAILAILAEEARYGLAIKRELEVYYDSGVNHGRLYPNLDELVEMELVEKSELDKRTNEYALTEAGHDAIVDHFAWTFSRFITTESRAQAVRDLVDDAQT
jgi:DNA-binding PadR family transcriptional regulator